ncbi:hypothetical protein LJC72_08945 [Bacteroides sp. OttesenSCG-928-D19]|nr:hypothetical protein [Bacteroides sp. OttesenSCG-928-N06]MDL2305446.1 hypothetical protein [Bacteroides sp. OttesenSCG-928-D19]
MKKIIYTLVLSFLLLPLRLVAADEAGAPFEVWTYPVVYNLDEKVDWYFDLTGTTFGKGEDIYLWIWSPSEPDAGNWENSSDFAKLTYVEDMLWRMEITPTAYFGMSIDDIKGSAGFWMRLKDKTGTKQSDVIEIKLPNIDDFLASGTMYGVTPAKFNVTTPIAILFNSNVADNTEAFAAAPSVHFHSGMNGWAVLQEYQAWLPDVSEKVQVVNMGKGIYRKDLIPYRYYGVDNEFEMENINFLFVGKDWSATSPDGIFYAADVPIPPPPSFYLFPLKVSINDVLILTRENNTKGQVLSYKVTGGSKVISGQFEGNMARQRAFVNIAGEFAGTGISKIAIVITDQNETVIYQGDIPLVEVDKLNK